MGRWAQRRRRGGDAGAVPPAPPPTPASVVSVATFSGTFATWTFDQAISYINAPVACEIDDGMGGWLQPISGSPQDSVSFNVEYPTFVGSNWQMLTDPAPDLTSAGGFVVPESGATS